MKATAFGLSVLAAVCGASAQAQIVTDGSVGAKVVDRGLHVNIPDTLGTTKGGNLFHSFEKFNIASKGSATFTQTQLGTIDNVISRVTGGDVSSIDGELISKVGNAAFWFINPAGVMFGPNASINVPAAFHVSTANRISFDNGDFFSSALDTKGSTLSFAAPESFGFLGPSTASISFNGSSLEVTEANTLTVAGGDISLTNSTLKAPAGTVQLASIAAAGEVAIGDGAITSSALGKIGLSNASTVNTTGNGGSRISIQGGELIVEYSSVVAKNTGSQDSAGGIEVTANNITLREGKILASTSGSGNGGNVVVETDGLLIDGSDELAEEAKNLFKQGKYGELYLQVFSDARTGIFSEVEPFAWGDAGSVKVTAGAATVQDASLISSTSLGFGKAGTVDVVVEPGTLKLRNVGLVVSATIVPKTLFTFGGDAGAVAVTASNLRLSDFGIISSDTLGSGNAGKVTVRTGSLHAEKNSAISSSSIPNTLFFDASPGNAGPVEVIADQATFDDLSGVFSDTFTSGDADTVMVTVRPGVLRITKSSEISSDGGVGDGGTVTVEAGAIEILGGVIASQTSGSGDGGAVDITVDGSLVLEAGGRISTTTSGTGMAGSIDVETASLVIDGKGSTITADTDAAGDGGKVIVEAGAIEILGGVIASQTSGPGDGGAVDISVDGSLVLEEGGRISTTTSGTGMAGSIDIETESLVIDGKGSRITADTVWAFADLAVILDIAHAYDSDLVGKLTGPSGKTVILFDRVGGNGDNFVGTRFDDQAAIAIGQGSAPFSGTYRPNESFGVFIGEPASGTWTLELTDTYPAEDPGTLQSWALQLGDDVIPSSNVPLSVVGPQPVGSQLLVDIGPGAKVGSVPGGRGGNVTIDVNDSLTIRNGAAISAASNGTGPGGNILITAPNLALLSGGRISAISAIAGDAGDIGITASEAINVNGSGTGISSNSFAFSSDGGNAGDVRLTAPIVSVADGAFVSSSTFVDGGDGGSIFVEANTVSLQRGGSFLAGTLGAGAGGQVLVTAKDSVTISGVDGTSGFSSSISTGSFNSPPYFATGDAGRIRIEASEVKVTNDGFVASDTTGFGMGGEIEIVADRVEVLSGGDIRASTNGPADAGNITVTARDALALRGPSSQISANSLFSASGDGGRILVEAPSIEIADGASVSSGTGGAGVGGTVTVKAATLVLTGGGSVDASTFGTGNGGNVVIQAAEQIDISGGRSIDVDGEVGVAPSGLFSISLGTGAAGNIAVSGPKELSLSEGATISTEALGADGGSIDIQVQDLIHLKNSDITTQVAGLKGDAGNIFIDPQFVVLDNSNIVARAVGGNGGNIEIVADNLIMDPQSIIDATSQLGVSGTVSLSDPETDVESALVVAEPEFLDPSSLLAETCAQRSGQTRSSLVRGSRGGLPEDPGRMLHATLIADQLPEDFETEGANGPKDSSLAILDVESFATRAGIQMVACR